jgi:hypothetical protein
MNQDQDHEQPTLFDVAEMRGEPELMLPLKQAILEITFNRQPSAWQLCEELEKQFGVRVFWVLKDAMESFLDDRSITNTQKDYFRWLLESDDLSKAIRGVEPPRRAVQSTIDHLIHQGQAYRSTEAFREMVDFMARFRDYSPYNNMLVKVQNPSCGFYATAKDWWNRHERRLKEDARPMLILAPMHPVMLVYDQDQTEGKEVPESLKNFARFKGEWNPEWLSHMVENAEKRDRIQVQFKPLSSTNAGFATTQVHDTRWKMRIVIHTELDGPSRFGVLCHELAHIHLGHLGTDSDYWWPSRRDLRHAAVEVEAESVAHVVSNRFGLEGESSVYVSNHMKGSQLPHGVSLDLIAKVAGQIEEMAQRILLPRKKKAAKA